MGKIIEWCVGEKRDQDKKYEREGGVWLHNCHPSKLRWIVSTLKSKGAVTFQRNRGVKQTAKSQTPCLRSSLLFLYFHNPPSYVPSFPLSTILTIILFHPCAWFSSFPRPPSFSLIGTLLRCFFSHRLSSMGTVWPRTNEKNLLVQHLHYLWLCLTHDIGTNHTDRQGVHLSLTCNLLTLTHSLEQWVVVHVYVPI